jgi:hypothetical protein
MNKFSNKSVLIVGIVLAALAPFAEAAETNTPPALPSSQADTNAPAPVNPSTFFGDAEGWFATFGSNTWTGARGFVETGAAYQNNVDIASTFELGYNAWSPSTNSTSGLVIDSETLNAGIAGVILSQVMDVAWRLDIKDVQILAGIGGGYNFQTSRAFPDIFGELQKKLGANTHAFIRLESQISGKTAAPIVAAGVGFSF